MIRSEGRISSLSGTTGWSLCVHAFYDLLEEKDQYTQIGGVEQDCKQNKMQYTEVRAYMFKQLL